MKKIFTTSILSTFLVGLVPFSNINANYIPTKEELIENPNQVCKVKTNGVPEFLFKYDASKIKELPKDVILTLDYSGSTDNLRGKFKQIIENFVNSLGENDKIFLSTYDSNTTTSYNRAVNSFYTKQEILALNGNYKQNEIVGEVENLYENQTNKNEIVSVLQITDNWGGEDIDTSFANWSLTKAKTFMSVVLGNNKETDNSVIKMKQAGHNNIFWKSQGEELTQEDFEKINEDFKTGSFNKPILIKLTPENGAKLTEAFLVHKESGTKQRLEVRDGNVNQEIVPEKEGNFYFDYSYEIGNQGKNLNMEVFYKNNLNQNILLKPCPIITKELPFDIIYENDDSIDEGKKVIFVIGEKGITENGILVKPIVNQIVKIGTKKPGNAPIIPEIANDPRVNIGGIDLNNTNTGSVETNNYDITNKNEEKIEEKNIDLNSAPEKKFDFEPVAPMEVKNISENNIEEKGTDLIFFGNKVNIKTLPRTGTLEFFLIILALSSSYIIFRIRKNNI